MHMKPAAATLSTFVLSFLLGAITAQAATVTGTVTNKTNGKPSAGDTVVLVDVQAGMADAATATTDARGHYSLETPGNGAYLIRVNHQGGTYYIGAPQGGGTGDVSVYDVAAKVDGVGVDAEMLLVEAAGGMLRVQERFLVRNTSLPPRAQLSSNTFEFVLPAEAVLDSASATRPGGLPTNTRPVPLSEKRHYTINIPIQPNLGEKETTFEVQYHVPYNGKYTFTPQTELPTDNLVVYVPKSMNFGGAKGASFQPAQEDPRVQTFVAKGVHPGQGVAFTIDGEGQMPREAQAQNPMGQGGMGEAGENGARPGGGIAEPIATPDPLSKYKWWILAGLALLLAAAAAVIMRKQGAPSAAAGTAEAGAGVQPRWRAAAVFAPRGAAPAAVAAQTSATYATGGNALLLNVLRDELFAIESEKISGTISAAEYAEVKAGLEVVLKRALSKK